MASTLVLALIAFIGICSAAPKYVNPDGASVIVNYNIHADARLNSVAERIVGGEATTVNVYPWIVQMEFYTGIWNQACAANILNAIYALSAAQCTSDYTDPFYRLENRRIRAGATERNTGGEIRTIMRADNHPRYNPGQSGTNPYHDADITLIRFSQPLILGTTIQSVPIAPQGYYLPDNVPVVHAGWGATSTNGPHSNVLQHVTVNSINNNLCRERYSYANQYVTDNMICTGLLNVGGSDTCQGDAGGPLFYGGTLVGIISWGPYCADPYYPRVSTRIASYTYWIISMTAN